MKSFIQAGLVANAATLGIHWIYDPSYIQKLSEKQSIIFLKPLLQHYEAASNAYFCYPNATVGDVTVQGEILKWLDVALNHDTNLSKAEYEQLLFEQFKPGGKYQGYVESYAQKQVFYHIAKTYDIKVDAPTLNDQHLVGFMPYIACKAHGLSAEKAFELAHVYTTDTNYLALFHLFDELLHLLPQLGMKKAIEQAIKKAPKDFVIPLKKAIEMTNSFSFIEQYAGIACEIKQSIPVIIHVLYHAKNYEDAVIFNAHLGGAISDRNTIIGAIFGQVSHIPASWMNHYLNKK